MVCSRGTQDHSTAIQPAYSLIMSMYSPSYGYAQTGQTPGTNKQQTNKQNMYAGARVSEHSSRI
jgi:hypothetical protein